jgi:hypothetical protein
MMSRVNTAPIPQRARVGHQAAILHVGAYAFRFFPVEQPTMTRLPIFEVTQ